MNEPGLSTRKLALRELFTKMITAFGAKDFDAFARYLRPDTRFEWPYLPLKEFPDVMIGGDAFVAAAKVGMADSDPYRHVVDAFYDLVDRDMLIVEYHSDTFHHPTQKRYANKYLGILRFEGDKVIFWKEYINPLPVIETYGTDFRNEAAAASTESEA